MWSWKNLDFGAHHEECRFIERKVLESLFSQKGARRVQSSRGMTVHTVEFIPTDAGSCGRSEGASWRRWCVSSALKDRQGLGGEWGRGGVTGRGKL